MTEIIISFFSIIGIALLLIHFFDYLFYRNIRKSTKTVMDLKGRSRAEIAELMELLSTVRSRTSGRAAVDEILILTDEKTAFLKDTLYQYLSAYGLRGVVFETWRENWEKDFLNYIR